MKSLMMGAALAGFMAGNTAMAQTPSSNSFSSNSNLGHMSTSFSKDKHACKGQNSCKGKGGCKIQRQGLQGQEQLQGQGRLRNRRLQAAGLVGSIAS